MKVYIRDDDLSYWSDYRIFESIYSQLDVPVSVSLVPNGINYHGDDYPYGSFDVYETKSVFENTELCEYLKSKLNDNKIEILLHGFTHEYHKINNKWIPEMLWREDNEIDNLIFKWKKTYEDFFNRKINFIICPSDKFKKTFPLIIKKYNLNTCGIIRRLNDRPFSIKTFFNYIKKTVNRLLYKFPYTGLMDYKGWKEIITYQKLDFNYLKKVYGICKKKNYDMVIEVHYWQLKSNSEYFLNLQKFVNYVKEDNTNFGLLSDIL